MRSLKTILLALLLLAAGTLSAQNRTVTREVEGDYVKITKIIPKVTEKQHDIRVGIGSVSLFSMLMLDADFFGTVDEVYSESSFRQQIKSADYYKGAQYFTGVLSLSYAYQLRHWCQLGGTVNFAAVTRPYYDNITNKKAYDRNSYFASIMPTVRFTYLNREKVQLYSTVSLGVAVGVYETVPCYDFTLFGCSFGKSLFGFAEIGNGLGGWGRVGIGYRFGSTKK